MFMYFKQMSKINIRIFFLALKYIVNLNEMQLSYENTQTPLLGDLLKMGLCSQIE